jgi:hypothetical protein
LKPRELFDPVTKTLRTQSDCRYRHSWHGRSITHYEVPSAGAIRTTESPVYSLAP